MPLRPLAAARNSLRALAITGAGPAELLRMLNGVMCELTSGVVGTVVCGLYNPATSMLRWARAGHLPPVLVRGRTASELPLPGGVLLGMDPDASYEEATQPLQSGDTLLLFTDGLIERRGESIVDVLGEFVATVAPASEGAGLTAAALADRILATAVSDTEDDACLVAVRVRRKGQARLAAGSPGSPMARLDQPIGPAHDAGREQSVTLRSGSALYN